MTVALHLAGEALQLLPQRAALAVAHRTLLVADAHFGKGLSFRRQGVPVPRGTTRGNLERLSELVAQHHPERLIFLGDFLHAAPAQHPALMQALGEWKAQHTQLQWLVIRGNHDAHAGDPPPALGLEVVSEPLMLGGLELRHHPRAPAQGYGLAGHLHPAVSLHVPAGPALRLPCFWFGPAHGVLPAFGEFTGMHTVRRAPGDRVYAVAEGAVWPV